MRERIIYFLDSFLLCYSSDSKHNTAAHCSLSAGWTDLDTRNLPCASSYHLVSGTWAGVLETCKLSPVVNGDDQLPDGEQDHPHQQDAAHHCQQHRQCVWTPAALWRVRHRNSQWFVLVCSLSNRHLHESSRSRQTTGIWRYVYTRPALFKNISTSPVVTTTSSTRAFINTNPAQPSGFVPASLQAH